MMLPSRLGCPLSLKTPNMGNPGVTFLWHIAAEEQRFGPAVYPEYVAALAFPNY